LALQVPRASQAGLLARIGALASRERMTRFSGGAFGYLWAFVTPVAWIALVVIMFWILGRAPPIAVGAEIFVATGILPYALFRQTITSMMRALIANRSMTYLQPVMAQDILLSAAVLELANLILTSLVIFGAILLIFDTSTPANLLLVYGAMATAWALGVGMGALFGAIGQASDSFYRAIPLVLRPLFWISGIFFTATELPESAQALFRWNPLLHCIEALREGFFLGYVSSVSELWYPLAVATGCFLASGVVTHFIRRHKLARHQL
jgi:capsular polysaccharide transport system permease protein